MGPYAQTNLQLYSQLEGLSWHEEERARIQRAYELAMRLFSGRYRASGKPFVAHLVGTASVLAAEGGRPAVILAGMLHAAYVQGDFGDGGAEAMTPGRRARLREIVGDEAEALVAQYTTFPWGAITLSGSHERLATMTDAEKDLVLMRLANELDDLLDRGILYHADAERRRADLIRALPLWTAWARELSGESFASALAGAANDSRQARIPAALRSERTESFRLPPAPPRPVWRRILRRLRSWTRRDLPAKTRI